MSSLDMQVCAKFYCDFLCHVPLIILWRPAFFLGGNVGRVDLGEREGDGGALGVVGGRQEKTVIRI